MNVKEVVCGLYSTGEEGTQFIGNVELVDGEGIAFTASDGGDDSSSSSVGFDVKDVDFDRMFDVIFEQYQHKKNIIHLKCTSSTKLSFVGGAEAEIPYWFDKVIDNKFESVNLEMESITDLSKYQTFTHTLETGETEHSFARDFASMHVKKYFPESIESFTIKIPDSL